MTQKSFKLINLLNYIVEDNFFTTLSIISAVTTLILYVFLSKLHLFYICMASLFIWSVLSILKFYKKETELKNKEEELYSEYKIPKHNNTKIILFLSIPFILLGNVCLFLFSLTPLIVILEIWYVVYVFLMAQL